MIFLQIYNLPLKMYKSTSYNLQQFDLFSLHSTTRIWAKSTIYKITKSPPWYTHDAPM